MKYCVLGCNGMAGHMISLYLHEKGHHVVGFARNKSLVIPTIIGDACNIDDIDRVIAFDNFDYIINCIGILNQDAEDNKTKAVLINSFLPHLLAEHTKEKNTKIIHLSTDCVFSGERGRYTEYDWPDGKTFYDRSKALGELQDRKNITIRTSIIGPDIKESGIGLLNWFMKQKTRVYGFTNAIWTGQTTLQLAKTIEQLTASNYSGLFHLVPNESISKYELLLLFNKYLRNNSIDIIPKDDVKVDKSLVRTKEEPNLVIPSYEIMIKELREWILSHKDLYKHYNIEELIS